MLPARWKKSCPPASGGLLKNASGLCRKGRITVHLSDSHSRFREFDGGCPADFSGHVPSASPFHHICDVHGGDGFLPGGQGLGRGTAPCIASPVITVISGWFFTAFAAFSMCFIVAACILYGGLSADQYIAMCSLAAFLLLKSSRLLVKEPRLQLRRRPPITGIRLPPHATMRKLLN